MFIDPNLDPDRPNYREFDKLLAPFALRPVKPLIEIHRSICDGDGPSREFHSEAEWKQKFTNLSQQLRQQSLTAEVFGWDDFHDRYLITDVIGIQVPAGFDVSRNVNELPTSWARLGRDGKEEFQRKFDPAMRSPRWRFKI
jgi:hypothetical protein